MMNKIPDISLKLNEYKKINNISKQHDDYFLSLEDDSNKIILKLKIIDNTNYPYGMSLYYGQFDEKDMSSELANSKNLYCHITIASPDVMKGLNYLMKTYDSFYNTMNI